MAPRETQLWNTTFGTILNIKKSLTESKMQRTREVNLVRRDTYRMDFVSTNRSH